MARPSRALLALALWTCALLPLGRCASGPAFAQTAPGASTTKAGSQHPNCTIGGTNGSAIKRYPSGKCGGRANGATAPLKGDEITVIDALNTANCATGGGAAVGINQWDGSGWICAGGGGGGLGNPLTSDLDAGGFKLSNIGAPTTSTGAARNVTLSGGAGITNAIGDLSANRSISVDATEIGASTWGDGAADYDWTFNGLSAANDPKLGVVGDFITAKGGANFFLSILNASGTSCVYLDGTSATDGNYSAVCSAPAGTTLLNVPPGAGFDSFTTNNFTQVLQNKTLNATNHIVGSAIDSGTVPIAQLPEATNSTKGVAVLAGDLGGSATLPRVQGINKDGDANSEISVTPGAAIVLDPADDGATNAALIAAGSKVTAGRRLYVNATGAAGTEDGGGDITIEGAINDAFEWNLSIPTLTADRNVSAPDLAGTLVLSNVTTADNAIARYDGTTGKLVQDSKCRVDDNGGVDCDANATTGGTLTLKEGADDGSQSWKVKVPDSGLDAGAGAPVCTINAADGMIPLSCLDALLRGVTLVTANPNTATACVKVGDFARRTDTDPDENWGCKTVGSPGVWEQFGSAADATASVKGILQLASGLGGTAAAPRPKLIDSDADGNAEVSVSGAAVLLDFNDDGSPDVTIDSAGIAGANGYSSNDREATTDGNFFGTRDNDNAAANAGCVGVPAGEVRVRDGDTTASDLYRVCDGTSTVGFHGRFPYVWHVTYSKTSGAAAYDASRCAAGLGNPTDLGCAGTGTITPNQVRLYFTRTAYVDRVMCTMGAISGVFDSGGTDWIEVQLRESAGSYLGTAQRWTGSVSQGAHTTNESQGMTPTGSASGYLTLPIKAGQDADTGITGLNFDCQVFLWL